MSNHPTKQTTDLRTLEVLYLIGGLLCLIGFPMPWLFSAGPWQGLTAIAGILTIYVTWNLERRSPS